MSLTKASYSMVTGAPVNVMDFGAVGDGVADDTAAIQAAIDSLDGYVQSVYLADNKTFRITSSLVLPRGRSIYGNNNSDIVADFSSWTGDKIAIKCVVDTADSDLTITSSFGPVIKGFRIVGANNASDVTIAMQFYAGVTIPVTEAVHYCFLEGAVEDITIFRFDTGINMLECQESNFINVTIAYCRAGLNVEGKSINNNFYGLKIVNPTNDYTSSTDDTVGVKINSGFHYQGGVEGRPEGFNFIGGLIYGSVINVNVLRIFQCVFESVIVDGAQDYGFSVLNPNSLTINNCYIYSNGGAGKACIYFPGVSSGANASNWITNNFLVGGTTSSEYGVHCPNVGTPLTGMNFTGNRGYGLVNMFYLVNCPNYSVFDGNFAENITSHMFYVQNGGAHTTITNNSTSSDVFPLVVQPSTESTLQIGKNDAPSYSTYQILTATLTTGATSVSLPNSFWDGLTDPYVRPVTTVTPVGRNPGTWYVTDMTSFSNATFTVASALAGDLTVRYVVQAVPYSAY